jgi:putative N6-adenine-specific DNA methylase
MNWLDYDKELHALIHASALKKISESPNEIFASDIDPGSVRISKSNSELALVEDRISWSEKDFMLSDPPKKRGLLVINPPYGRRIDSDIELTYHKIGEHLRKAFKGWTAWIVVPSAKASKALQMKSKRQIAFQNGDLDCMWQEFDIYTQ